MDEIVFVGAPHEVRVFAEAGLLCHQPAPGHLVDRVVAEQERCDFLVMTRETFTALPPWLARDLLTWKPGQVFVISQLPRTSLEKQLVFDELRRKAARARRLDAQEQTGQHAYG